MALNSRSITTMVMLAVLRDPAGMPVGNGMFCACSCKKVRSGTTNLAGGNHWHHRLESDNL